ncbi:hypothetical protein LPJ70_007908, partial [Coemansia sp. RSA 2708]
RPRRHPGPPDLQGVHAAAAPVAQAPRHLCHQRLRACRRAARAARRRPALQQAQRPHARRAAREARNQL